MKVLYATDGSEPSKAAALLLKRLANPATTVLTVFSVADHESMFPEMRYTVPDLAEKLHAATQAEVDAAVSDFHKVGFSADGKVVEGVPGKSIVHQAKHGRYDLVIVGSGSSSWLAHRLLGSVSTCVLHNSPVSVMVVHEAPRTEVLLRVLVATDGSRNAGDTAADLVSLADPNRCETTVLSVAKIPYPTAAGYSYPLLMGFDSNLVEQLTQRAREHAESLAGVLTTAGFRTEVVATDGSPHRLVLEMAKEGGFDLVVVGSRGHGAPLRGLLGSVSDAVARHAQAALVGRTKPTVEPD